MSLSKARELRAQRGAIAQQMAAMVDTRDKWTAEDKVKFDKMDTDQEALKVQAVDIERAEAINEELRKAPPAARIGSEDKIKDEETRQKKHRSAFFNVMKNGLYPDQYGFRGVSEEDRTIMQEFRDMGTGGGNALQGSGGGFFVPVGFVNEVEEAMKWYGDMLKAATIFTTTSGQPLPWPTDNDTAIAGELVGEGTQVTTQDLTLGNIIFGAYKFSTKMVKVSIELLQDSAFDIEAFLKERFATRLGRVLNTYFTTGTGTAQPKGIIPAATLGATAIGSSGNDGGAGTGANSIGTDDLISLEHSVDKAYRPGGAYMAHDLVIKAVKQLKDKYGRPIWLPGLAVNSPDTILSYPYFTNNDMDTIATTKKTALFGQIKKYMVRRVKELAVLRLTERFADNGQVAFIGFSRYDGNLLDAGTHPVTYLQQA